MPLYDVDVPRLTSDLRRAGVHLDGVMLAAGVVEVDRDTLPEPAPRMARHHHSGRAVRRVVVGP